MNNEEPTLTQIANLQISHEGHKLPEQADVAVTSIPRPFNFMNLINQWQPMGCRVVLNLPFIGDDKDFLFAIRNGPFIPRFDRTYKDAGLYNEGGEASDLTINSFAFNNMRNVIHAKKKWSVPPENEKEAVYITYYDYPPVLSQLALMFRKWRGSMEYRIRVISGFSTQGYLFAGVLRNSPTYAAVFDQFKVMNSVARQDDSYREVMQNSYIMSDTSMFRHFKIHVPYEYPSPWYDQFRWIGNRSRPSELFEAGGAGDPTKAVNSIWNEPHGDNFIVIGMRGALNTSVNQAQISFELEYRAGEDFQFADPGLPAGDFLLPASQKSLPKVQIPDKTYTSDGIGFPKPVPAVSNRMGTLTSDGNVITDNRRPPPTPTNPADNRSLPGRVLDAAGGVVGNVLPGRNRNRARNKRDIDDGIDTVDDLSDTSDVSQLSDFDGINLRKSLRRLL
ncbi:hypothetical protein 3 [Shuangao insect virus 8]|uniref:Capsid protein n=1 Tax=Shuangao insect virus 8 TaxID=1923469 RepID=A0A1L3KKP3_9VIRU|nr:hypothetical protein 3 [Shuangao insect virus 8]APG77944.1 hypothetical protein 3 [Shuangao insect virus 8]